MLSRLMSPYKTQFRVADAVTLDSGIKIPIIKGVLSETNVISPNGYRYRDSFWRTVLSRQCVKDAIKNREMLGCEEHPISDSDYIKTPYSKATHVVRSVTLRGNNPYGEFGILNTTNGNNIKALVDVGIPLGVSTRGLGDTLSDNVSSYIDEDNYSLITWDIVNNPNFASLRMSHVTDSMRSLPVFNELVEAYGLRDSAATDYKELPLKKEIEKLIANIQVLLLKL